MFGKVNLNSCCVPIFQSLASTVAEINRGPNFFGCSPGPVPPLPPILVLNVVFYKIVPNPSCIPTVAKIHMGSQIFLDAPLAQTPANCGPKRCFFGKLVPNPSCVPNLKLLASTVTKIHRGSQFFLDAPLAQTPANFGPKHCFPKFLDAPLAQPPPILVLNVVFGKQHSVPKWCKNFVAHVHV